MNRKPLRSILFFLIAFTLILSACSTPAADVTTPEPQPVETEAAAVETLTPEASPTLGITPTSTPDTRPLPEDWMNWPVVPTVTNRAMEIYQQGLAMGNDPHAFSKIGDCQSIREAFMGFFDLPDRYTLTEDEAYLQETIDWFSGHFNTDGQGVRGGFNAAAVLSPLWADPTVCLPGENPLECELRITRPMFVIISLEVWWDGRTPEQYEALMRRIIEYTISQGAIPILATKADNVEGDNSLNLVTAQLAYEYDLPLWNFWAAVQDMPNHGLDPSRPDGFHISIDAWNVRSFTALQTLDSLRRGLSGVE